MKTKILIIALLVVILTVCLCVPVFAYADTSSELVNFNQLVFNDKINFTSSAGAQAISDIDTVAGHIYYYKFEAVSLNSGTFTYQLYFTTTTNNNIKSGSGANSYVGLYTCSASGGTFRMYANGLIVFANVQIIDLTQMFGSSASSMTVADCQDIFVAEYYAYNTGTPIYTDSINAYAKGVSDTLSSFDITYNNYAIGSGSFLYTNDVSTGGDFAFDSTYNAYYWQGVLGVYLGGVITRGTTFTFDFTFWYPGYIGDSDAADLVSSTTLHIAYVDSNNNLVDIVSTDPSSVNTDEGTYTGSFVLPLNTDTIYLYNGFETSSSSSSEKAIALSSSLTFQSFNVDSLLKQQKEDIYEEYNTYYGVNGTGYNAIYNAGYSAGLEAETPYTFGYLMSSVIEAPLNAVLSIFNFDFLGVNFKNVITLILTLCIIIAIVRLFMGGKE